MGESKMMQIQKGFMWSQWDNLFAECGDNDENQSHTWPSHLEHTRHTFYYYNCKKKWLCWNKYKLPTLTLEDLKMYFLLCYKRCPQCTGTRTRPAFSNIFSFGQKKLVFI